jgi:tripartite-type tricarboxylate transporter receptor subunit TctC
MTRLLQLATLVAALAACGEPASAQYPDRPIKIIVPLLAGSASDNAVRIIGAKLSQRLGQQIVIENRVGGSTIIGTEAVARAAPDGYTIGLANTSTHATASALMAKLPFDPIKDFAPIGMIGTSPFMLVASGKLPVASVRELIALAKSKPDSLTYASAGVATIAHLGGELFKLVAGVEIRHVPYRGTSQSVIDLMEGRIDLLVGTISGSYQLVREGKLRGLAIMGDQRVAVLPDVPTIAEAGVPGCDAELWQALVFPAGVRPEIVARMSRELAEVVRLPDVQEALRVQGIEPITASAEDTAARIKAEVEKWAEVIRKANIKPN